MNNEPVAWMSSQTDEDGDKLTMLSTYNDPLNTKQIPLYTHLANPYKATTDTKIEPTVVSYTHPVKELTDEEIMEVHRQIMEDNKGQLPPYVEFARAILRKAQEK
jgi:hypothetical protein